MLSLGAISIMSGMIDEKYTSIVPTIEQSNAIITPLLRIIDRHTKITEVHPDVTDMLMFFAALTAYAFEARATYILLKEKEVESDNDKRKNTTNLSDYVSTDNND